MSIAPGPHTLPARVAGRERHAQHRLGATTLALHGTGLALMSAAGVAAQNLLQAAYTAKQRRVDSDLDPPSLKCGPRCTGHKQDPPAQHSEERLVG